MVAAIRNPIEWLADQIGGGSHHIGAATESLGVEKGEVGLEDVRIQHIDIPDLRDALRAGLADLAACRTDVVFLCLVYSIGGLILTFIAFDQNLLQLLFPAMAGFVLLGPVAAVGLYELSRRREKGEAADWRHALAVLASPSFGAIVALGLLLVGFFVVWLIAAQIIYDATLGPEPPASLGALLSDALTTGAGWVMIVVGFAVGFVFAAITLATSVVSFPMMLDKHVGAPTAIVTSLRVTARNLRPIAAWGLIVAVGLAVGSIPLFLGLVVVLPILGHATWHLYRKVVTYEGVGTSKRKAARGAKSG
ncbi:DUF2189 domain-containing protein [Limibaculum sp. M0105]|uniref:DUF2189 domain-containing protein n=1 Tax=Thermohalobaculum xanthum TaxID=2753746 RepID=A0A8J7SBA4_9RHOB|nr:DUF2189 domain-containing protein [Thermohalobaculum xanthum]MBK0398293.1 DUF2189 domain-containing protein [Thermohalobaculum xanthum]